VLFARADGIAATAKTISPVKTIDPKAKNVLRALFRQIGIRATPHWLACDPGEGYPPRRNAKTESARPYRIAVRP
jgi:hypothetical protein